MVSLYSIADAILSGVMIRFGIQTFLENNQYWGLFCFILMILTIEAIAFIKTPKKFLLEYFISEKLLD